MSIVYWLKKFFNLDANTPTKMKEVPPKVEEPSKIPEVKIPIQGWSSSQVFSSDADVRVVTGTFELFFSTIFKKR